VLPCRHDVAPTLRARLVHLHWLVASCGQAPADHRDSSVVIELEIHSTAVASVHSLGWLYDKRPSSRPLGGSWRQAAASACRDMIENPGDQIHQAMNWTRPNFAGHGTVRTPSLNCEVCTKAEGCECWDRDSPSLTPLVVAHNREVFGGNSQTPLLLCLSKPPQVPSPEPRSSPPKLLRRRSETSWLTPFWVERSHFISLGVGPRLLQNKACMQMVLTGGSLVHPVPPQSLITGIVDLLTVIGGRGARLRRY
jgi:hypothetical protein